MKFSKIFLFWLFLFGWNVQGWAETNNYADVGLMAYWNFDAPSNNVVQDVSGNGNHGLIKGNIKMVPGVRGNAAGFDGNSWIEYGTNACLNITNRLSMEVWIKANKGTENNILGTVSGDNGYKLRADRDGKVVFYTYHTRPTSCLKSNTILDDAQWNYIVVTFDPDGGENNKRIYINGTYDAAATIGGAMDSAAYPICIGNWWGGHFRGVIDELKIYNRVMSAEEIKARYNQSKPAGIRYKITRRDPIVVNSNTFFYAPRYAFEDDPISPLIKSDRQDGFVIYSRDPRNTYRTSIPRPSEVINELTLSGTAGECESTCFAIYALSDLKSVKVEMNSALKRWGTKISADKIDIRVVNCRLKRTGFHSDTYCEIPELLGEKSEDGLEVKQGETQGFYIKIAVPATITPGNYIGRIRICAGDHAPKELPITLKVLPFTLVTPVDRCWVLATDINLNLKRWSNPEIRKNMKMYNVNRWSGEELREILNMVKDVGISGIVEYLPYGKGWNLSFEWKDAEVVKVESADMQEFLKIRKEIGLTGPVVLSDTGGQLRDEVGKKLGLTNSLLGPVTLIPEMKSDKYKNAYISLLRALDAFIRTDSNFQTSSWLFEVVDEPASSSDPSRKDLALWGYSLAKMAGLKTEINMWGEFAKKMAPYIDVMTYGSSDLCLNGARNLEIREEARKSGYSLWYYGSGCYAGQEGGLMPNRYMTGLLFWKSGAIGEYSWTFCQFYGDPYNDFDGYSKDPMLAYPSKDQHGGMIPTLQWEGIREGIKDYKYLYKISRLIESGKAGKHAEKFIQLEKRLESIIDLLPWLDQFKADNYWLDNDLCNAIRRAVADEIVNILDKKYDMLGERLTLIEKVLRDRIQAAQGFNQVKKTHKTLALERVELPCCAPPPKLDGNISDYCRQKAVRLALGPIDNPGNIKTDLLLACDRDNIYFMFTCYEPDMDRIKARIQVDEQNLWEDDCVELFLCSDPNLNCYYHFIANSNGRKQDIKCEIVSGDMGGYNDYGWNSGWQVKAMKGNDFWLLAGFIPLKDIGYCPGTTLKGNFCRERFVLKGGEYSSWVRLPVLNFHDPEYFGTLALPAWN